MATLSTGLFQEAKNFSRGKKGSRTDVPVESLEDEGRVLGLYFSAHWCPPCRDFTPKLAEWYIKLTGGALKDKLEIVFVSSDRDEDTFDEYFDSMPWLCLPYNEKDIKVRTAHHALSLYTIMMFFYRINLVKLLKLLAFLILSL